MAKKVKSEKLKVQSPKLSVLPGGKLNNFLNTFSEKIINFKKSKTFYVVLLVAGLLLLAIYKKNWFVAAMVNGSPITNLELQMRLNKQFRTQTLNQLINEKIILGEAAKSNSIASDVEINNKISEIETQVGGTQSLDALLSQQGQTKESLKEQIRLQLSIEKLYANEATVSAEEVSKFIEQNKEQLQATDSAGQEKEATEAIKNQKLSQLFSQKFQELKTKAKVQTF